MDQDKRDQLLAMIGGLMGEHPTTTTYVGNRERSAFRMGTSWEFSRRELDEWFKSHCEKFPADVEADGLHIFDLDAWPEYLGEGQAAVRFINWAVRRPGIGSLDALVSHLALRPGLTLQGLLADALCRQEGRMDMSPLVGVGGASK
jgi:hypothetical protein